MTAVHYACSNDNRAAVELCLAMYKNLKEDVISKGAKKADKIAVQERDSGGAKDVVITTNVVAAKPSEPKRSRASGMFGSLKQSQSGPTASSKLTMAPGQSTVSLEALSSSQQSAEINDSSSLYSVKRVGTKEQLRLDMLNSADNIILEAGTINELRPLHIAVQYDARDCVQYLINEVG
jgi:ankyrin repeat protein